MRSHLIASVRSFISPCLLLSISPLYARLPITFTAIPFPSDLTLEVGLPDKGEPASTEVKEPERRFKVVIREVNQIDTAQLLAYCKGDQQAFQVQGEYA